MTTHMQSVLPLASVDITRSAQGDTGRVARQLHMHLLQRARFALQHATPRGQQPLHDWQQIRECASAPLAHAASAAWPLPTWHRDARKPSARSAAHVPARMASAPACTASGFHCAGSGSHRCAMKRRPAVRPGGKAPPCRSSTASMYAPSATRSCRANHWRRRPCWCEREHSPMRPF
jgi:hypothetical protein